MCGVENSSNYVNFILMVFGILAYVLKCICSEFPCKENNRDDDGDGGVDDDNDDCFEVHFGRRPDPCESRAHRCPVGWGRAWGEHLARSQCSNFVSLLFSCSLSQFWVIIGSFLSDESSLAKFAPC